MSFVETLIGSLGTPQVVGQTDQFFGFVATVGENISSIRTRSLVADTYGVDNIEITGASVVPAPIPEPSTLLLFGTGLAGLAAWRYRKGVKA